MERNFRRSRPRGQGRLGANATATPPGCHRIGRGRFVKFCDAGYPIGPTAGGGDPVRSATVPLDLRRLLLPTLRAPIATAFACHALAAAVWWWAMPGGFAPGSGRFWVNQVFPPAAIVVCGVGLYGIARRERLAAALAIAFGLVWISAAISARVAYPISLRLLFVVPLLIGVVGVTLGALLHRATKSTSDRQRHLSGFAPKVGAIALLLAAIALGAWLPWTQRGPEPTTRTLGALPDLPAAPAGDTTLLVGRGRYFAQLDPTLTFVSRSPDRGPSLLAPRRLREQPDRRRTDVPGTWRDGAVAEQRLTVQADGDAHELDGLATVDRPVWSHLNSYALLMFSGHRELSVSFSPTGEQRFAVLPSDYPVGRPARFACVTPDGRFVVLEASSAEKGPFTELAGGPIGRGEPITLTFFDGDAPIAAWTLVDFTAHASTAPSPTAGHGVPQNAIRFTLEGNNASSPAVVYVTLAGTGVGRGYDTVAHAAGTYRLRHTWRWLASERD